MQALCRHNFSGRIESAINNHIQTEQNLWYTYHALSTYCNRDGVNLKGFAKFFFKQAVDEKVHITKLIHYLNRRGGRVVFDTISKPTMDPENPVKAIEIVLNMEKEVTDKLEKLYNLADEEKDPDLQFFLEEMIEEQKTDLKRISDMITSLRRVGDSGMGLFLYDKYLYEVKRLREYIPTHEWEAFNVVCTGRFDK